MNVVMIIPTGIGCEIGGHAGDATPAARLLASVCDTLILHPNVVNASDINEMPENSLYVEGSILDRFLEGSIELERVKHNKILVAANRPVLNETINTVSAARACLGVDAEIIELMYPLTMKGYYNDEGIATGDFEGVSELLSQIKNMKFDALAISSHIELDNETNINYWEKGGVNPWGGIEAIVSKTIASKLNKPVAHAPLPNINEVRDDWDFVADPRMAAEVVANDFLYCCLKGLHKAPRIGIGIGVKDVDVMVSPYGCWDRPHEACIKAGIPIIAIRENRTIYNKGIDFEFEHKACFVENYLEAAGMIAAMRIGINPISVKRPLSRTNIIKAQRKINP